MVGTEMSSPPSYLCVFHAAEGMEDDVRDLGEDPDFRNPATWGICRPNTRRAVQLGSHVFFLGFLRNPTRYLIKGWLRVGEKIGYVEALERFGDRPNVILRDRDHAESASRRQPYWKNEELRAQSEAWYGPEPSWLATIKVGSRVFVQNPADEHELDNWKCQRMFMCQRRQFERCLRAGICQRESEFPTLSGYIVASEWRDIGPRRVPWEAIAVSRLPSERLRTPYGQHNHQLLTDDEVATLKAAVEAVHAEAAQ